MKTLKVYPRDNKLDAEIEYEQQPVSKCRILFGHKKWRTVERWRWPFGEPRATTQICEGCGALRHLSIWKDQEGELIGCEWIELGYVLPKWRDYDPYHSSEGMLIDTHAQEGVDILDKKVNGG